ncbi:MAG: hypothetical protein RL033_6135, partial [Pseudomonadota bacterium]
MNRRQQLGASLKQLRHSWKLDNPWRIAGVAAIACILIAVIALGPVVRSVAMSRARSRGVELDIGSVRPGWFSVQLRDTTVQLIDVPALQVKLDNITVSLTPWLSLREIELHGGEVLLTGAADGIVEQLQQWRAARRSNSEPAVSGRAKLALRGDGLSLRWSGAEAGAADQVVSGIYFERDEAQRAGFDQAKFQLAAGALEIAQAEAEFVSTPDGPALSSATVAQIIGRLSLNPAITAGPAARALDDPAAEEEDAEDPEAALPDSPAAGAAGAADPPRSGRFAALASVPWERRQAQLGELRALARRALAEDASVTLTRVQLELARGDSVLNVGPAPFRLVRKGALISASF